MARKELSRKELRARALRAAKAVSIPDCCDVCVIGAGPAGLAAAITAAEAGAKVVVLDQQLECGHTILATGNGRCNFGNVSLDFKHYNDPSFVEAIFGEQALDDILGFFREAGMRWELEDDRLYPMSFQAASVQQVLLKRARAAGVVLGAARTVRLASQDRQGVWQLVYALESVDPLRSAQNVLSAQNLIVACGPTAPLLASIAEMEGLSLVEPRAALCPVECEDSPLLALDGRRVHGALSLVKGMFPTWHERGEVLLRSYGLSGVVTFNLSRRASLGDIVLLDLVPDLSKSELQQIVDPFLEGSLDDHALDGVIDPQIAAVVVQLARQRWQPEGLTSDIWSPQENDSATQWATALAKALPFRIRGFRGEQAQVHAGGLTTSAFSPDALAAQTHPSLFAAGEALDVDGDCGGYNLMWAWKSGMVAGASAAAHMTAKA